MEKLQLENQLLRSEVYLLLFLLLLWICHDHKLYLNSIVTCIWTSAVRGKCAATGGYAAEAAHTGAREGTGRLQGFQTAEASQGTPLL